MYIPPDHPFLFHLLGGLLRFIFIFSGAFFLLSYYLKNSKKQRQPAVIMEDKKVILSLRLQAHERFVLFLERIYPSNLVIRLNNPDLTSSQLQSLLVRTIREEFEYNLSQQLYVTGQTWELIKNAKEEMVALINQASVKAGDQAMAGDLVKAIFEMVVEKGKLPSELALEEIRKETQKIF
ncbi:MAG: hypothetical protein WCI71_07875 [Bacteroidota bacterium]